MLTKVYMPKNGMDMTEGTLVRWLKQVGEFVEAGEGIMEIETDKVTMEAEAPASGFLLEQLYAEGSVVPVLTTVGYIGEKGDRIPEKGEDSAPAAAAEIRREERAAAEAPLKRRDDEIPATPLAKTISKQYQIDLRSVTPGGSRGEIRGADVERIYRSRKGATPLAAAMSRKLGIELSQVDGTGFRGKITKEDILRVQAAAEDAGCPAAPAGSRPQREIPLNTMRRVISRRMLSSHLEIPPVTACVKVDVTRLLALREEVNASRDKAERVSINDFIIKAAGIALLKNERFRMSIDKERYILRDQIDIGVAVSVEDGLLVPVVRNVDQKNLFQISHEAKELAATARRGALTARDTGNACITISNLGMYGTYYFTPIINQPEASIIGVCSIEDELTLADGQISVRKKTILCTTYDHRIINGAEASGFQADLKALLERPTDILLAGGEYGC
nr:dihydrolipoamide acetyltransferase family protein [uncultured Oscillibacter sp.]